MSAISWSDSDTDRRLVEALNRGDPAAFDALYHRYRDWVVSLALRYTGEPADALDVLQETFLYLLRKVPHLEVTGRLTTLLYPVVRHTAQEIRRKRGRSLSDTDLLQSLPADPPADNPNLRDELAQVMADLPAPEREVLLMRFVDGMALKDVAEALGLPVGTVKSRLHRAVGFLRQNARTRRYFFPEPSADGSPASWLTKCGPNLAD